LDNVADRVSKGRTKAIVQNGEANGMSKLESKEVESIKKLYKSGTLSQSKLAKMFNVRQPHISRIVNETRRSVS
jgi:predicted XRE-type DNA-binding protein